MKIKKVTGILRDFGNTIEIWLDGFLNYAMIMVDFFGVVFPSFFRSLLMFHFKIRHLSRIYDWQHAVLPLAIDYHTEFTTGTHTDVEGWALPQHWVDQYCFPLWVLQNPNTGSCKRAASSALDHANPSKKNGERFAAISIPRVVRTRIAPGNTNAVTAMLKTMELMHAPANPNNSSQVFKTYTIYSL